jgi:uncharacterized protein with FMN-binding domain
MRRAILAVSGTAAGMVVLLAVKPHEPPAASRQAAARSGQAGEQRSGAFGDDGGGPPPDTGSFGGDSGSGSWTGAGATAGATTGERAVTGQTVTTRWGPVQVKLIITQRKITGIRVLQAPSSVPHDISVNERALPILDREALAAQNARIDSVSGASYTSEGYVRSLQSAIDKAGL